MEKKGMSFLNCLLLVITSPLIKGTFLFQEVDCDMQVDNNDSFKVFPSCSPFSLIKITC